MKRWMLLAALLAAGCSGSVGSEFSGSSTNVNVADAALRGGSPQVALQLVTGILAKDPDDVAALTIQGDALTLLGRTDAAAGSYEKALARDSSSARAKLGLARLRLATDPATAERMLLELLQRTPRDTAALNNLGIARDLLKRHADAQAAYRQVLGINPDFAPAQVNLALSLAMSGKGSEALPLIQPLATASGASRKLRHDYAAVLALSGRRADAERILSADLTPAEVNQVMAEFGTAARPGSGAMPAASP